MQLSELPVGQPFAGFASQSSDQSSQEPIVEKTYEIGKFREWRFEVAFGATLEVKVYYPLPPSFPNPSANIYLFLGGEIALER